MSDNNKGISPFKDPAFLKGSDKLHRTKVSSKDINEFKKAFSDDEETKHIPSLKKRVKKEAETSPATQEELYATPDVDIDAFFESITGKKPASTKAKSAAHNTAVKKDAGSTQKTRSFSLNDSFKKRVSETVRLPGEEKNIKKNVRVLVKSTQSDRHILDILPDEEEKTNIIDVLGTQKGENIFEAVDKAVTKDTASAAFAAAVEKRNETVKHNRDKKAINTGKALRASLIRQNKTRSLQLIFCLAAFIPCAVLTVLPSFYSEGNGLSFLFANGARVYSVINILLIVAMAGVFYKSIISGALSIKNLNPNSDSPLFVITLFILLHNLASLITGTAIADGTRIYTCFAAFAFTASCLAEYFNARTALGSLTAVMKGKRLQSIQPIENASDAVKISGGITDSKDVNILYSTEVEIGDSLTDTTGPRHSEGKFYSYSLAAVIVCAVILGILSFFTDGSIPHLFTVTIGVICFCSPVTVSAACSFLNYMTNYRLNRQGAAATSKEGIRLVGKAQGVAMDISDIFTAEVSSFRTVPGTLMKKSSAALITSAVLINAKTLIGKSFENFVSQTGAELPLTENVEYEEKLGFSAWVSGKRVLVGNREMLIQHSISVPDEREERHYAGNRFVMYLVVEGMLTASFLVNYKTLSSVRRLTDEFNKTGLVLLLTSNEPFLDYKETAKRLSLESAGVRILSGKAEKIVTAYTNSNVPSMTSGLICPKAGHGLLNLVVSAYNLYTSDKFLFNLHLAGQVIAFILLALGLIFNMPLFFSPFTIIFLELIWSACAYFITVQKSKL